VTGRFEVLEHTADVGLRVRAGTPAEVLEAAAEGLATLEGAWFPGRGAEREVLVDASDLAGLLVTWLDELLYLRDAKDVVFGGFAVRMDDGPAPGARARVRVEPRGKRVLESAGVKAATYHGLRFEREKRGWVADVYLDV
jgi:SHS2 domain-containing protein